MRRRTGKYAISDRLESIAVRMICDCDRPETPQMWDLIGVNSCRAILARHKNYRYGCGHTAPKSPNPWHRGRALFAALSSMFSWLKRQRRIESNPCAGVHRPAGPKARDRVLTADEIRWFWRACESVDAPLAPGAPRPFGPLLKVLLLTGQRRNEVAGMTRDELSDDGATWNIPGSRTKNGRAHVVPLPPLVRELIASVRAKPGNLVFTTTGTTPVSGWSRMKGRLDAAMLAAAREEGRAVIPPWTLHDLRRTFVTGMVELRVPPHVVEVTVNHIGGTRSGVAGTYNRSELMDERKEALERWATHVAGIVAPLPENVVSLPRKRRRK